MAYWRYTMDFKEAAIRISSKYKFDEHAWELVADHANHANASIDPCSNHLDEQFMTDLNNYAYLTNEFIVA